MPAGPLDRPVRNLAGEVAHYLLEPFLDAAGRREYRKQLLAILPDLASLKGQCADGGRLVKIERQSRSP